MKIVKVILLYFLVIGCKQSSSNTKISANNEDPNEKQIRSINIEYVEGWKNMNEEKIMSLFEDGSRIQPNSLKPIEGKDNIRNFWFPKDGSITKIHDFNTELLSLSTKDSIAITTHLTYIDWSYKKDSLQFGMVQKGINTTVYRKKQDTLWKIWRKMWTDIYSKEK